MANAANRAGVSDLTRDVRHGHTEMFAEQSIAHVTDARLHVRRPAGFNRQIAFGIHAHRPV